MSISTIEQQIKNEYNVIHAFLALHPWMYTVILGVACWTAGRFRIPF